MQRMIVALALLVSACGAAPAAEVAAGRSTVTDDATAKVELEKIQKDWGTALMARDTTFFARIMAEDLTMSGPDGVPVVDRATSLKDMADTTMSVRDLRVDDMRIRLYSENTAAVVTGVARAVFRGGKQEKPASIAYTETFVNRDGRWQVVAGHYSMLPPK